MANIINQADAERVLRIIDSLVEHVPDDIKVELDSLKGLLQSPLFYQYLDYQDLQKISQLSNTGGDIEELKEFCQAVQNLKLSELEIENCSNISTDHCNLGGDYEDEKCGDETLVSSPSNTLRHEEDGARISTTSGDTIRELNKRKVSIKRETITLDRIPGQSLGFDVCGTVDSETPGPVRVFVQRIKPGDLADRDGRLVQGDEIIAINGDSILDNEGGPEAFQQVLKKIGEQTGSVIFTIKRKLVNPPPPPVTEIPERAPNSLSLSHRKLVFEPDGSVLKPIRCDLVNNGAGLGFGIVDDVFGNVRVNTILQESPAQQGGTLQLQDVLLEVNGAMVRGLNQQHIARLLQCASPNVSLVLGRTVQLELEKIGTSLEEVTCHPLTFCENTGGVRIHSAPSDSPIQQDDVILMVNDISVELVPESQLPQLLAVARNVTLYRNLHLLQEDENNSETKGITEHEDTNQTLTAIWESEIQIVEFEKRNATLGISILPLIDPLKPTRTVIVIDHVQEESGLVGRVMPGSRLTSINDQVFDDCSFDIVTTVMKMTPSGAVRLGITPLVTQPLQRTDSNGDVIHQHVITVCNNADFPGITLKPSPHSLIAGYIICRILPGGLFHVDGRLKTGDIIVTLNYSETSHMGLKNIRAMVETSCKSTSLLRVSYVAHEDAQQQYTVAVPRHPKTGIGICIVGGSTPDNPTNGIYIKKIVDIDSPLKKGEQIIKVNELLMTGLTHEEAVEVLRTVTSPLTLTLQTPSKQGSSSQYGSRDSLLDSDNVFQVSLPRTREALGMKLGTCEQGLIVTHVEENSAADVIRLTAGDVIFKVNDTVLRGVPQDMMMPILRQQDGPTNVTVVRKPPRKSQVTPINSAPSTPVLEHRQEHLVPVTVHHNLDQPLPAYHSPDQSPVTNTNIAPKQNAFTVGIKKSGTTSLGINVVQRGSGIFVKNIVPDFPASECDNLRPGDQILAVNEHPLTGMSRNKAIAVLRKVEGDVTLLLTRPNVAMAHVTNTSSDKENSPSSRSPSPYVELEQLGRLQNSTPPPPPSYPQDWSRDSVRSSEPDSVRSSEPDIAALKRTDNMTPDNISLRSHQSGNKFSPGEGGQARQSDTGSVRSTDSRRSSPVLRRQDTGGRDVAVSADRRISWHDSPIENKSKRLSTKTADLKEVDTVTIKLHNSDSGSGIILFSQPHAEGILVKSITTNTPASQLVWPQDLIIRINENITRDMAVSDAAIILSETKAVLEVEVKRDSPLYQIQRVTLDKPKSGSLGLSITERRSLHGIYISQVTPGGAAEKAGVIERGQRILSINGVDVKYMRQPDFISLLKSCGNKVDLTVGNPVRDYDNRSTSSSQKHSPGSSESPGPQRSSNSNIRSSHPSRGSPYSSQRSIHSARGLMRQSPPPSPLVHSQRSSHSPPPPPSPLVHPQRSSHSPQGSPRLSHRSYGSPHGSPRGSQRSTNTPVGSPRESRMSELNSQYGPVLRELGSHPGSQRELGSHPGSQRELGGGYDSQRELSSHQGSARELGSHQGSQRDYEHGPGRDYEHGLPRDYDYGSERHSTPHGSLRDYTQRELGSHPGSQRELGGGYTPREFNMSPNSSQRDEQGSYHGSQRDFGGRNGAYRDVESHSLRSSHHSQQSAGTRQSGGRKPRHPSPSRSTLSTQSKRSNMSERDMRSDSLTHYSVVSLQSDYTPSHGAQSMTTHSLQSLDNRSNVSVNSYTKPKPPVLRTANLYREKNAPLGLSLAGGRGWPLGSIPLFISSLQKGGIAARSGVLKEKDRIVSINGTNVEDFSHEDAVRLLREATSPVTLVVTDPDTNRPDFKMVKLTRSQDGLGFSIVGGKDNIPPLPITIKQVYETGPAYGKLKRGDQIISVNGKSIEDYTREDATLLLKSCTETVTLVIRHSVT